MFYSKDHGADDDLKLLNVIEAFCKTKPRQSINVNVQDVISSAINKSSILPQPTHKIIETNSETNNIQNFVGSTTQSEQCFATHKNLDKHINKLLDEKKYIF